MKVQQEVGGKEVWKLKPFFTQYNIDLILADPLLLRPDDGVGGSRNISLSLVYHYYGHLCANAQLSVLKVLNEWVWIFIFIETRRYQPHKNLLSLWKQILYGQGTKSNFYGQKNHDLTIAKNLKSVSQTGKYVLNRYL